MNLLFFKASAKYCAPMRPILLCSRFNTVSVCEKIENKSENELEILLDCFSRQQLSIVLQYF